jgi:SAM-dependent methyltransferase
MSVATNNPRECGDEDVTAGRGPGQLKWYEFAPRFVRRRSVLDAGCGMGKGLEILRREASLVHGQDLDERLAREDITVAPLSQIESKSFDVVTSIDVIEHVQDVPAYLSDLKRIARDGIFLTTPNWTASRCRWPYHLREYTPRQLENELSGLGPVTLFKGTPAGDMAFPIRHRLLNHWFNSLRTFAPTAWAARCWNNLLPLPCRIHSHLAAWIDVTG